MSDTNKLYEALASAIYMSRLVARGEGVDSDDKRLRASGLYEDWTPGNHKTAEVYNTHTGGDLGKEWNRPGSVPKTMTAESTRIFVPVPPHGTPSTVLSTEQARRLPDLS